MKERRKHGLDRGMVFGLVAVVISIAGVLRPAAGAGEFVKVTGEKPATCPAGQRCGYLDNATVTTKDVANDTLTPADVLKISTKEMEVPAIQRRSTSDQTVANDADSNAPTEALEFQGVPSRVGGASAPKNCPVLGNLVASSCVIVAKNGIYDVTAKVIWENNGTGKRAIWGLRFHPTQGLDTNTLFTESGPASTVDPDVGGQVQNLSYSIDMLKGEGIFIAGAQSSGGDLDVLAGSVLTVTWSANSARD